MAKNPVVASYIADFLKPEQLHVYRQLTAFTQVDCHVYTHKRENERMFPYHHKRFVVLPKPRTRWLRRFIHRTLRREPWQIYRWELRRLILDLTRIDAGLMHIYFGHVAPQFIPLMVAWPHPVVVSFHGADAGVDMDKPRYRQRMQEVFQLAAKILCRSESLAGDLIKLGCPEEKIALQRTGIPLEAWEAVERQEPADGSWEILQACRFVPKKGLDVTLGAFAALARRFPKARLTLMGDGPLQQDLERQAQDLGITDRVTFAGFVTEGQVRDAMRRAHLFVHPSRTTEDGNREGVPNSLLEAMATGMPIVATRHGGIPEAVTDGESGMLAPENDPAATAAAMTRLLEDAAFRARIAAGARRAIEERFSRDAQVRRLEACYKSLMQSHPSRK